MELDTRESYTVVFKKEGHSDVACDLRSGVEGRWLLFDVVVGPLVLFVVPLIIDATTGDWRAIGESACNVVLPPAPAGDETRSPGRKDRVRTDSEAEVPS